ncbi:MAG TPA: signal peptidase I [Nocardioidaceae bacterium]|nr:signal peptidase I [Nocardioidaceae bacterium]
MRSSDPDDRDPGAPDGSRSFVGSDSGASGAGAVGGATADDSAAGSPRRGRRGRSKRGQLPLWQEVIVLLALALGLAIVLKALFLQAFYIPSDSMRDTLMVNDRILVQKVSYWFGGEPERGDIVVFKDPGGWLGPGTTEPAGGLTTALEFFGLYPAGGHLVKRVIGVEGDHVVCCDAHGRITVNGEPLDESSYLMPGMAPGAGSGGTFDVMVPQDELWVMGDNRAHSADSRVHIGEPGGGFIPVDDVVGKVFLTVWPLSRASVTDHPESFDDIPADPQVDRHDDQVHDDPVQSRT